ncbi:protein-L-isoaspartate O-methyltransferase [Mycena alexandri]|uniref:protein-L-isoaspartate(D-aspartate) O-methyltransferase n=1 Tax=Mycena alexandri TaxID=1745969 RepID=A0AAD6SFF0_9AGAR|nr:protein-L-isoaspartate O-methyltransferase [Mycena alexandri]
MAWRCSGKTNAELVGNLMKSKILQNSNESQLERISLAMQAVDRAHFVTDKAIGHGATISAPHMHAYAADHLLPGSGYLCAVLHHLVSSYGDDGKVAVPGKLVDWSLRNLTKMNGSGVRSKTKQVEVHVGDGRLGKSSEGPYDAIHVGAASPTIPEPLVAQLARPGRMFIPVGTLSQHIIQVDKDVEGNVTETQIMAVNYVPLTDRDKQKTYTW